MEVMSERSFELSSYYDRCFHVKHATVRGQCIVAVIFFTRSSG